VSKFTTADQIEPEAIRWAWKGYLPAGKLVLLDGDPGRGKSVVLLSWVASVTTGSPLPDGSKPARTGGAVILAAEDGQADTVVPRLIAAGADRSRIIILHAADSDESFSIPKNLDRLAAAIDQVEAVMVVVDPITSYLEGDINKDQELRRCLRPLLALIANRDVVAIGSRHLNKDASMKALYRGGGSVAMIGQARVGLLVGEDPDDDEVMVIASPKANLGPKPPSLRYRVTGAPSGAAFVEWLGASEHGADDLVEAGGRNPDITAAEKLIRELILPQLAASPMLAKDADALLSANGITAKSSINRAKKKLGIRSDKAQVGASWWWLLQGQEIPSSPTTLIRNVGNVGNHGNVAESPQIPESPKTPAPPPELDGLNPNPPLTTPDGCSADLTRCDGGFERAFGCPPARCLLQATSGDT
jgi:hypothetical protein